MSSSWSELIDNSSDKVSLCDEMENVLMAWTNVNDISNACVSVAKASVSTPDDSCNGINKKLSGFEKEHFSSKNVMSERSSFEMFLALQLILMLLLNKFAVFV